jgi:hypothetical protein
MCLVYRPDTLHEKSELTRKPRTDGVELRRFVRARPVPMRRPTISDQLKPKGVDSSCQSHSNVEKQREKSMRAAQEPIRRGLFASERILLYASQANFALHENHSVWRHQNYMQVHDWCCHSDQLRRRQRIWQYRLLHSFRLSGSRQCPHPCRQYAQGEVVSQQRRIHGQSVRRGNNTTHKAAISSCRQCHSTRLLSTHILFLECEVRGLDFGKEPKKLPSRRIPSGGSGRSDRSMACRNHRVHPLIGMM